MKARVRFGSIERVTCAGLTVPKVNEISKSDQKFLRVHCRLDGQSEIIKDIKANLSDIHTKLDELLSSMSVLRSQQEHLQTSGFGGINSASEQVPASRQSLTVHPRSGTRPGGVSRINELNLVVYGIHENSHGLPRSQRRSNDLKHLCDAFTLADESFSVQTIQDCLRLGRYVQNHERPRPVLVRFNNLSTVTSLLQSKSKLRTGIYIKPHLSKEERSIEGILLRERRRLIDLDVPRSSIKIRKSHLIVNDTEFGHVRDSQFHYVAGDHPDSLTEQPINGPGQLVGRDQYSAGRD